MGSCLSSQQYDDPDEDSSRNHSPRGTSLIAEKTETDSLSRPVTFKECRMCLEEQISADDPVVQLGCMCLGDNGLAHESCIRKWFPQRLLETGRYDCEICNWEATPYPFSCRAFDPSCTNTCFDHESLGFFKQWSSWRMSWLCCLFLFSTEHPRPPRSSQSKHDSASST